MLDESLYVVMASTYYYDADGMQDYLKTTTLIFVPTDPAVTWLLLLMLSLYSGFLLFSHKYLRYQELLPIPKFSTEFSRSLMYAQKQEGKVK